jgi:hypothetical protein
MPADPTAGRLYKRILGRAEKMQPIFTIWVHQTFLVPIKKASEYILGKKRVVPGRANSRRFRSKRNNLLSSKDV